ncbi:tyrosine-type recombinase/integrase [Streptomyces agglomeratus]|uniref:tyrosine-type recombinase/integrase n=1 Tax=Streptomyces agglomeratus TaxID=285458 RepID=UPI00099F781D|nr:tyrosine-type recombinase/integrase [Streptomyces agglomeratus]
MKGESLVPIDEEIHKLIIDQQQRVLARWTDGCPHLFPRPPENPDGGYPTACSTYWLVLYRWLQLCEFRDQHGRPAHFTPHQWRHTLGTRMINRDVPQEVVRRILDHDTAEMTAHYVRLHDTTVREHWEKARKVNISGQARTRPRRTTRRGGLVQAAALRATQALPNGYCGRPSSSPARTQMPACPARCSSPSSPSFFPSTANTAATSCKSSRPSTGETTPTWRDA